MQRHPRQQLAALGRSAVLLGLVLAAAPATELPAAEPQTKSVALVIDYGDGAQLHLTALPWRAEMTVLDALSAAQKHPHGINFVQRGRGATALVTQIGDLKNQGAGKNWIYSVNDQMAEVGAGGYELAPGDRILWEFKEYE